MQGVVISDVFPFTFDPVRPDTALQLVENYEETAVKLIRYSSKVEKLMEGPEIKMKLHEFCVSIHPDLSGLVFFIYGGVLSVFNSDLTKMIDVSLWTLFGEELETVSMKSVNGVAILTVEMEKKASFWLATPLEYYYRYYQILPAE